MYLESILSAAMALFSAEETPVSPQEAAGQEAGRKDDGAQPEGERDVKAEEHPDVKMSLHVQSVPQGADVYIDGRKAGETPFSIEDIEHGSHTLLLSLKGYLDWEGSVMLIRGRKSIKMVKLKVDPSPRRKRTFLGLCAAIPVGAKDGYFVIGIAGKLSLEHAFDDYVAYYVEAGGGPVRKADLPVLAGAGVKLSVPAGNIYPFLSAGAGTGVRYIDFVAGAGAELYFWDSFAIFAKAEASSFLYGDFVLTPAAGAYVRF